MSQPQTGTVSYSFPELMTIFIGISDEAFSLYHEQWSDHPDAAEYLADLRAKKDLMPYVDTVARENDWPKLYELPENIATNINILMVDTYIYDLARMQKMLLVLGYLRALLQRDLNIIIFGLQDSESNQPIQRPTVEEPVSASSEADQKQAPLKPIPRYAFQEAIPGTSGLTQRVESSIDIVPETNAVVERTGPRHAHIDDTQKLVPSISSKEEEKLKAAAERHKEKQLEEKLTEQNQEREYRAKTKRLKEEQLKKKELKKKELEKKQTIKNRGIEWQEKHNKKL